MNPSTRHLLLLLPTALLAAACAGSSPTPSASPAAIHPSAATASATAAQSAQPTVAPSPSTSSQAHANGRIAFTWMFPGSDVNNISTIAADGSGERKLTSSHAVMSEGPEWIPNSDRLLFDSDRAGCCHLFTMDGQGGDVQPLKDGSGGGYASMSADGSTIAIDSGDPQGIFVVNADGSNPRRVTTTAAKTSIDSLPAFSPDGTRIAFERILSATPGQGRTAIFVVNVDGTDLKQLTDWVTNASYPNWSPDGTRIVFNDNADNGSATVSQNVWVMNPDGTNARQLTHTAPGQFAFGADWSPDGTKIVYVSVSTNRSLAVMNTDGSSSAVIWTAPTGITIDDPDWGPDL